MHKIGLKLWSINKQYKESILSLYDEGIFDYIELYIKPNTFSDYNEFWKDFQIPFEIHAAHFGDGVNLSMPDKYSYNMRLAGEALSFADKLNSSIVIFHPGVGGSIDETVRQLRIIGDSRIVIENKPQIGLKGEQCIGHSVEQMKHICDSTNLGFCLDIGHAICSANSKNEEVIGYLNRFNTLKPKIYHLTDGDLSSEKDSHLNYGTGTYPIYDLLSLIPNGAMITNEAKKDDSNNLNLFKKDIMYLRAK